MSKGVIGLLAVGGLVAAAIATQAPEIRRYLKIRQM
jgi:hypothetical protein